MDGTSISAEQRSVNIPSEVPAQMSVGQWIITFLILWVPLLNIIMLFIWAFDSTSTRRNFSRAQLIIAGITILLFILLVIIMIVLGMSSGIFSSFI